MKLKIKNTIATIYLLLLGFILLTFNTFCHKNGSRVSTNSNTDSTFSINTTADSISFIVIGDWGRAGSQDQKKVAEQMDIYAKKYHINFIITTGDNFYPDGVSSIQDPHWQASFENIYNKAGHQVTWYPVLGNHDYGANPQAEIEYSSISSRWKMPSRYYTIKAKVGRNHSALFAFTDTSPFVTTYYNSNMADLKRQDTALQLAWLRQKLTGSNDTWKIVIGHHPVYSMGSHGNTPELIERYKPIFLQSNTDFYICGHDHNLQAIVLPNEPVRYLVSGGGGAGIYTVHPNTSSLFTKSSLGFLVMTLYPRNANIYFYNENGELLYQQQVKK